MKKNDIFFHPSHHWQIVTKMLHSSLGNYNTSKRFKANSPNSMQLPTSSSWELGQGLSPYQSSMPTPDMQCMYTLIIIFFSILFIHHLTHPNRDILLFVIRMCSYFKWIQCYY